MNSNPSEIYNIDYTATWSDKEKKSSFCRALIAHDRAEI